MIRSKDKRLTKFLAPLVPGNMLNPINSTILVTAVLAIVLAFKEEPGAGAVFAMSSTRPELTSWVFCLSDYRVLSVFAQKL
jgi:hypothetical protein